MFLDSDDLVLIACADGVHSSCLNFFFHNSVHHNVKSLTTSIKI